MIRLKRAALTSIALLALLIPLPAPADTNTSLGDRGGEGTGPLAGLAQSAQANLFTGTFTMSVPIVVPPGHKNATPDLKLAYSSNGGSGAFGTGWDIPMGSMVGLSEKVSADGGRCLERFRFTASHFNEKARWALDFKRVRHVRRSLRGLP